MTAAVPVPVDSTMLALLPVRDGVLPTGALEAASESRGSVIVVGSGVEATIEELAPHVHTLTLAEVESFAPAAWSKALAPHLVSYDRIVLPGSPDGRDLAPRLSAELRRPLVAGVVGAIGDEVQVARHGGLVLETLKLENPVVISIVPGVSQPNVLDDSVKVDQLDLATSLASQRAADLSVRLDTESIEVTEADAESLDLTEARRIIAGGAGLHTEEAFEELASAASAIDASLGGTRVVMDKGWIPFERQIGTTGIMVNPDLYISLGISGAVQHTAGLGEPKHIIAVNTDPHCPMMAMADLALVTDAPLFLREFLSLSQDL